MSEPQAVPHHHRGALSRKQKEDKKRGRVVWDEDNLRENDRERTENPVTMRIDEPKTPFNYHIPNSDSEHSDSAHSVNSYGTSPKPDDGRAIMHHLSELRFKVNAAAVMRRPSLSSDDGEGPSGAGRFDEEEEKGAGLDRSSSDDGSRSASGFIGSPSSRLPASPSRGILTEGKRSRARSFGDSSEGESEVGSAVRAGRRSVTVIAEDPANDAEDEDTRKRFKDRRSAHYNEFKVIEAFKQRNVEISDDEDDDDHHNNNAFDNRNAMRRSDGLSRTSDDSLDRDWSSDDNHGDGNSPTSSNADDSHHGNLVDQTSSVTSSSDTLHNNNNINNSNH